MIITLIILSLVLGGYSFFLYKKTNNYINKKTYDLEIKLYKKNLYLLDEINNKIEFNKKLILKELEKLNYKNQKDNNTKHQQLISNEFKKLKSDINKDLDDIVESVKNIKVF